MDEFSLIETFFKNSAQERKDVIYGIGDDAACVTVPVGNQLLISTDTLIAEVHFLSTWDAYDIAWKAVMVNVSDIAAMGGKPCWVSLALSLPEINEIWLQRFSQGLQDALKTFDIALIGGDTTRGALSITLTIHGLVPSGKSVRRNGAQVGDGIFLSAELGAAAFAVDFAKHPDISKSDLNIVMKKLLHPMPRIDFSEILQSYASAAIDISDGLDADLHHICRASNRGACLFAEKIPIHPLVKKYQGANAIDYALSGGDDYELCFTVAPVREKALFASLKAQNLSCYKIGIIEEKPGMRIRQVNGKLSPLSIQGYKHF